MGCLQSKHQETWESESGQTPPEDVARLQKLFNQRVDAKTHSGTPAMNFRQLLLLLEQLGEPHEEEEVAAAISNFHIAPDGSSEQLIEFGEFMKWWEYEHASVPGKSGHRGAHYADRFKLQVSSVSTPFDLSRLTCVCVGEPGTLSWRMYVLPPPSHHGWSAGQSCEEPVRHLTIRVHPAAGSSRLARIRQRKSRLIHLQT